MLLVGLTGGIGSGKSTVSRMLAARGAVIVDADDLAREAVDVGGPALDAVVARFGGQILDAQGRLDRKALATIVFADPDARADLEAIVHPQVRRRIAEAVAAEAGTDHVVVLASPLLIETQAHRDLPLVIVVAASPQTQLERLVARGMDAADARARIAAQLPLAQKAAQADVLLDNEGTEAELEAQVDTLWARLRTQATAG